MQIPDAIIELSTMDSFYERWLSPSGPRSVGPPPDSGAGRVPILTGRVVQRSALSG